MNSNTLESLRDEIDSINTEMTEIFVRRMKASEKMASVKREKSLPVHDPKRERDILAKVAETVGPELENEARLFFTTLMSISRGIQRSELSGECELAASLKASAVSTPQSFPSSASVACSGAEGSYASRPPAG